MKGEYMSVNSKAESAVVVERTALKSSALAQYRAKSFWIVMHRWIGIIAGLPIALIGLSGSLILLAPLLLTLQHGDLLERGAATSPQAATPDSWVAAVRAANTDKLEIIAVSAPNSSPIAADTALVIGHTHEGAEGENHRVFSINPDTGKLKGYYDYETSYAFIPTAIHTSLMIPMIGFDIVAITGVILLISSATGVYLWWPRPKNWKAAFRFKMSSQGLARWFSLHNFIGLYSAAAIFILSATGVWILAPEWVEPAVKIATPLRGAPLASLISRKGSCPTPTTVETALNMAIAHSPKSKLAYLLSPEEGRDFFEINLSKADNWNVRDGDTTVYIDPVCAKIVDVIDGDKLSAGESLRRATMPMHNGQIFGTVGQVLVFFAGLALPVMYVSGLILWWRRRKLRKAS
jgi:uncharacterized iron-regulated membrane protein